MKLMFLTATYVVFSLVSVGSSEKLYDLAYYELVQVRDERIEDAPINSEPAKHSNKRRLRFDGHGRSFNIHLEKSDAIPEKLKVISQDHNNAGNSYVFRDHQVENRYYHGKLKNEDNEPVVASGLMLDEGFKGRLSHHDGEEFELRPLHHDDVIAEERREAGTHVLYKTKDILTKKDMPQRDTPKTGNKENVAKTTTTKKVYGREDERWIEVIPVVTHEIFKQYGRNMTRVVEKVFEWIHLTDGLFQELEKKTRCVFVGLLVWDKFNEATADIYTIPGYAQKVMWDKLGLRFDVVPALIHGNGWWGVSWVGTVCGKRAGNICSVDSDRSIGILIRHEIIHTLGLWESAMGAKVIKDNFNKLIDNNKFPCLYQRATNDFVKNTCGNGVKEPGEVCDCLTEYECKLRGEFECCDPKTCQLRTNMQCMEGGCCEKCMFKKKGSSCKATDQCLSQTLSTCEGNEARCPVRNQKASPAQKIGCYTLKANVKPLRLFDGGETNWLQKNNAPHLKRTLCQCARQARLAQREYFGMMSHDECVAVRKEDMVPIRKDKVETLMNGSPDTAVLPLTNAFQSSTYTTSGCTGGKCVAGKAIDGRMGTGSVTLYNTNFQWWAAQLPSQSRIHEVIISTNKWAFNQGFFDRLKVEAGDGPNGPWRVCKGVSAMCKPYVNHVIRCDGPTVGGYIRLGVYGGVSLYLSEVKVKGTPWKGAPPPSTIVASPGPVLKCQGECYLADTKWNKDTNNNYKCNNAKYFDKSAVPCTSDFKNTMFVYKVNIPNTCPGKTNTIAQEFPTKKGCYKLKSKATLSLLVDYNPLVDSPSSKPHNMNVLVRKLLCQCAEAAREKGGKFIALHNDNRCSMLDESDLGTETNAPRPPSREKRWRADGRCGPHYKLPNGQPGECDPDGKHPCCSPAGWCGDSGAHCGCDACTDHRPSRCYLSDGFWKDQKCDAHNLHENSPHQCVGSGKSYFVYQL